MSRPRSCFQTIDAGSCKWFLNLTECKSKVAGAGPFLQISANVEIFKLRFSSSILPPSRFFINGREGEIGVTEEECLKTLGHRFAGLPKCLEHFSNLKVAF
ncbi:unnamed protein product [Bathycoccus prasinos]